MATRNKFYWDQPDYDSVEAQGKNGLPSDQIFAEKEKWRSVIFPPYMEGVPNNMSTWEEDRYYGKLDLSSLSLLVKDSQVKQLRFSSQGATLYAVGFVADAWRDFVEAIQELVNNDIIPPESAWASPRAVRAWTSPIADYNSYMETEIYSGFTQLYINQKKRNQSIVDFRTFLGASTRYMEIVSKAGPLSLSGFIKGIYSTPLCTGLQIEIGTTPYDDDAAKLESYGTDVFTLVAGIASRYGFSIDRNVPYRLVADLSSTAMREYMQGVPLEDLGVPPNREDECKDLDLSNPISVDAWGYSRIPGFEGVRRHARGYPDYTDLDINAANEVWYTRAFEAEYMPTWKFDAGLYKLHLANFYNQYVGQFPWIFVPEGCDQITTVGTRLRQQIGQEVIKDGPYSGKWDVKTYYFLRLLDSNQHKSVKEQRADLHQIMTIYDFFPGNQEQRLMGAWDYTNSFFPPASNTPLTIQDVGDIIRY